MATKFKGIKSRVSIKLSWKKRLESKAKKEGKTLFEVVDDALKGYFNA